MRVKVKVVDIFCGIGGLTYGLNKSGLQVVAGYDIGPTCRYAYEANNDCKLILKDIRELTGKDIEGHYDEGVVKVMVGCPPCQPFSRMRYRYGEANAEDEKYGLLLEFVRVIKEVRPAVIVMENVPGVEKTDIFKEFKQALEKEGYYVHYKVIYCPEYGIPQTRRRLVLVGSLLGSISIIGATHNPDNIHCIDFIGNLPAIKAGETDPNDPLHHAAALSEINQERIKHSRPGGTWKEWPEYLRCNRHKQGKKQLSTAVYGRMTWEQIPPTITTQFYNYGSGRFGHPVQDRALSLREGAILQTFPADYRFVEPNKRYDMTVIARHIGNAVPVRLGQVIGESIVKHIRNFEKSCESDIG